MPNSHVSLSTPDSSNAAPRSRSKPGRSSRLMHIDTIRGLLLVLMAVNHIPSDLHTVTDHPFGFMSAAEGFVFMAGLMAGFVYTRKWARGSFGELRRACTNRAVSIYRWHASIYVLVLAGLMTVGFWAGALPLNTPSAFLERPALSIVSGLLLIQQPTLFDILPMYCVLLVSTPWLLRICSSAGGYARLIFGSFALWTAANLFCPQVPFDNGVINTGAFNLAAWQLIYVAGLAFGHRWSVRQQTAASIGHATSGYVLARPSTAALTCLIVVATLLFSVRHGFIPSGLSDSSLKAVINKNNFAPLRLLDTALIIYLGYLLISRNPRVFSWQPFAWIGQASLTVFSTHVFAAYAIHAFPETFAETSIGRWCGTAIMLLVISTSAALHNRLARDRPAVPSPRHLSAPALKPRQPRTRRLIVRHEPRPPVPADSFHRRSR